MDPAPAHQVPSTFGCLLPLRRPFFFPFSKPPFPRVLFSLLSAFAGWVPTVISAAGLERGTWFWSSPDHPCGSSSVVGHGEREDHVIDIFKTWEIVRIYGSYSAQTQPVDLAQWNRKLHERGRISFLLLSRTAWIHPDERDHLRATLGERLIGFNAGREDPMERFRGLHFDIEPHLLPEWRTASPVEKRDLLFLLRDMFADARQHLRAQGAGDLPVIAAFPVWFSRLPPELGGRGGIGWSTVEERDAWFEDIAEHVDGISLMAFETASFNSIRNNVSWEKENFNGEVIVALRANPGVEWSSIGAMWKVALQLEELFGGGIDIQPFRFFADQAAELAEEMNFPLIESIRMDLRKEDGAMILDMWAPAGGALMVETSSDLLEWFPWLTLPPRPAFMQASWADPFASNEPVRIYRVRRGG